MSDAFALFDFDRTIVRGDSIALLWRYAVHMHPRLAGHFARRMVPALLISATQRGDLKPIKDGLMSLFGIMGDKGLHHFTTKVLPLHFFAEAVAEMERLHRDGVRILLVSASPEAYIKYLDEVLPVEAVLGTQTDEKYRMIGKNNRGEEKVRRIEEYLGGDLSLIDYHRSFGYSDSYRADRPMLELVKHRYLINDTRKREGYTNLSWHRVQKKRRTL